MAYEADGYIGQGFLVNDRHLSYNDPQMCLVAANASRPGQQRPSMRHQCIWSDHRTSKTTRQRPLERIKSRPPLSSLLIPALQSPTSVPEPTLHLPLPLTPPFKPLSPGRRVPHRQIQIPTHPRRRQLRLPQRTHHRRLHLSRLSIPGRPDGIPPPRRRRAHRNRRTVPPARHAPVPLERGVVRAAPRRRRGWGQGLLRVGAARVRGALDVQVALEGEGGGVAAALGGEGRAGEVAGGVELALGRGGRVTRLLVGGDGFPGDLARGSWGSGSPRRSLVRWVLRLLLRRSGVCTCWQGIQSPRLLW